MTEVSKTIPVVLSDVPGLDDKLDFAAYANTLRDIILNPNTETPLTIGIFGSWGSGKTSLMKMIERGLQRPVRNGTSERQTYTVWFNAWLYSKEESLWRALIMQVLNGVCKWHRADSAAIQHLNKLADHFQRAAGPMELGHLSIAAANLLKKEGANTAELTLTLQHGLDLLENIAEERGKGELEAAMMLCAQVRRATATLERLRIESLNRSQQEYRALIEKYVLPHGCLVIFVDDLDRCLPDKAVEVLEAIKLFLDVPGCIFVLGIARDVVERGIHLRYGELGGMGDRKAVQLHVDSEGLEKGAARYLAFLQDLYVDAEDVIDGKRYLEKIVQIPFVLPPISPEAMDRFVAQLMPDLPNPRCRFVFVYGLKPNPRQVKRALNIFVLLWGLAQNQPRLAGRISPVRLAKLVVLQQRHSDLYERLHENPSMLIAWEVAFRIRRDRERYQMWARGSGLDCKNPDSPWSLEAPFPNELEAYKDQTSLGLLLTMFLLEDEEANFVDMTVKDVRDLVFLVHSAEGEAAPHKAPLDMRPQSIRVTFRLWLSDDAKLQAIFNIDYAPHVMHYDSGPIDTGITLRRLQNWADKAQEARRAWELLDDGPVERRGIDFFGAILAPGSEAREMYERALRDCQFLNAALHMVFELQDGHLRLWPIPWECLHDGKVEMGRGFLGLKYPVYRLSTAVTSPERLAERIQGALVVAADPTGRLAEIDAEVDWLVEMLMNAGIARVDARRPDDEEMSDPEAIKRLIRDGGYQLLHFTGHGQFDDADPSHSKLVLGRARERGKELTARALADIARESDLVLVYLNACEAGRTADQAALRPWEEAGLVDALMRAGVPAIVGMQWLIGDRNGRTLAQTFYTELLRGKPVEHALMIARQAIADQPDWANPVLVKHHSVLS